MKYTALTLTSEKYFDRYAKFISEADGTPQRITSPEELENYEVLVLSGGGDMGVKSGAYGDQTEDLPIGGVNDDRDDLERKLLDKAFERKMPVLGICRGMQVMNVFLGGTLWPDIGQGGFDGGIHREGEGGEPPIGDIPHWTEMEGKEFEVTSHHHQGVRQLGKDLQVISKSSDGMIEAVKHETLPWFAVQWHPERTSEGLGRALPREWLRKELQRCTDK
ncbi:MAG: hypothetical protein CMD14_03840 [Flavobacteriales bacterium]|nr:hypothetical protein [Flavobacteriales bacterium]